MTFAVVVLMFGAVLVAVVIVTSERARASAVVRASTSTPVADAWTDAIDLGLAALRAMRDAHDSEIVDALVAIGVEPWLASRLVTWIPDAFARRALPSTTFEETYTDAGTERRYVDDPIWVAARSRADGVSPAHAREIAERSAAMDAARAYLSSERGKGRTLPDITGTTTTALVSPLPAIVEGDGGVLEPRAVFGSLLAGHGLAITPTGTTAKRSGELEIDAHVVRHAFASGFRGQVDFVTRHPRLAGGRVVESFVGQGPTYRAAMADAITKFERGTLHVLIATLADETSCADQVTWDTWPHRSGARRACLGPQLLLWGAGPTPMGALLDALREALANEPLDGNAHSLRVFAARDGERSLADEVLLDGEPWPAGEALCRGHDWPIRENPWATRLFLMIAAVGT